MKKFILLEIFALVLSYVSFDSTKHCDCSELNQNECNQLSYWCSWYNDTCISHNQNCENLNTQTACLDQGFHCTWDSKNTKCSSYECSNFTSQKLCLTHKQCYWFNDTCSDTFTKCEDYTSEYCSYLTDKDCVTNDTKCVLKQFPTNCDDDNNCVEDFTSADKKYKCVLEQGKCYKIYVSDPCSTFNFDEKICEKYPQCVHFLKCVSRDCSNTVRQDKCDSYIDQYSQKKILCEWINNYCVNVNEPTSFTEGNCFQNSFYNYKWNSADKKCQECKQFIANTPIYETMNDFNVTINDTIIYSTDPVQINLNKRCSCRQFDTQTVCETRDGCQWGKDYQTEEYTCIPYDTSCFSRETQQSCESYGCQWLNTYCVNFTECSNANSQNSGHCALHRGCIQKREQKCELFTTCDEANQDCPSEYGCEIITLHSGEHTYTECSKSKNCISYSMKNCQGKYQSRNNPCYLANDGVCKTKFTLVKYQICEDFDDSRVMCQSMKGCAYVDDKCIKGKCYQFPEDNCYHQRNGDGIIEMCDWNKANNQCDYAKLSTYSKCDGPNLKNSTSGCQICTDLEDLHYTEAYKSLGYRLITIALIVLLTII